MKHPADEMDERIEALHPRIDALFPEKDRGYGDDMRNLLRIADNCGRFTITPSRAYADSITRLLSELLDRMEIDEAERKAEDEHWSRVEREWQVR